jgi:CBS domain-containing protein
MDRSRLKRFINQQLVELPLVQPLFVSPSAPVRTALAAMQQRSQSCVLAGAEDELAGILTERDVLLRCMAADFDWGQPLAALLSGPPDTISREATVAEAIALMHRTNHRTLPVTGDGRVVGLIRVGDLLTHLAEAYPEDVLNLPPRPHQVMETQEGG